MTWQMMDTAPRVRFIPPYEILGTDCDTVEIIRWRPHDAGEWVDRQGYVIELKMIDESGGPFFELWQDGKGPIRADLEDLIVMAKQAKIMLAQEGVKDV